MGTSRSAACSPALSVNRNPDAARDHDKTTSLERLELGEQGLSKPRAQPWLTVVNCVGSMRVSSATEHKRCGFEVAF